MLLGFMWQNPVLQANITKEKPKAVVKEAKPLPYTPVIRPHSVLQKVFDAFARLVAAPYPAKHGGALLKEETDPLDARSSDETHLAFIPEPNTMFTHTPKRFS